MLTGDLVRVRIVKNVLNPSFIDPSDGDLLERAALLIDLYRGGLEQGWTRGQLDQALTELEGVETDIRLTRGLAKVLADRADVVVQAPMAPAALREKIFGLAAQQGPLGRVRGPLGRRVAEDVLADVAAELQTDVPTLQRALYADLKDEQTLLAIELPTPDELLHRYNVGLAQAALLRATSMVVRLTSPDPKRMRQLYRGLKFHTLMYRIQTDGDDVVLEVDGPMSLLAQSTRYGLQLALFLPMVLLQPSPWTLRAELRWGQRKLRKELTLTHTQGLRSPAPDTGAWHSRAERFFEERFRALNSDWTLEPGEALDLGGQELLVPDFTFRKGDRVAHLDIIGTWRKPYLKRRVQSTPPNVILAVSSRLAGEAKAAMPDRVIAFAEIIPAQKVLDAIEVLAR